VAILKVAQMGHPVLRRPADPVDPEVIATPAFQQICRDLLETMDEYDGAGLAAPQVHLSVRLVVLTLADSDGPEIWVNPQITPLTDTTASMFEGCLSIEGLRGRVSRPARVHVRFLDHQGTPHAYVLQGFPAVVAQHECDHLDGVLFVDRVDTRTLAFLPEYRRYGSLHRYTAALDEQDEAPDLPDDDVDHLPDAVIELPHELEPQAALEQAAPHLEPAEEA